MPQADGPSSASAQDGGLPPLREVIGRYGLKAKKSLGQNFLLDLNVTRRIARAAGIEKGQSVLEIGPGPGGLTRALLERGGSVTVVERDARFLPALQDIADAFPGQLTIIAEDALKLDEAKSFGARMPVVANLPYNVGTVLLLKWLTVEIWPPWWTRLTLMFQREVAERLAAPPGSRAYGRISVLAQWRADVKLLFDINPNAFVPPPKVTSTLIQIVPLAEPRAPADGALLARVLAAAFGQRRKMLRQSLKSLGVPPEILLEQAGLDPTRRAETVDVEGFCALARALARQ